MKKFLAMALAINMTLSFLTPVLAADSGNKYDTKNPPSSGKKIITQEIQLIEENEDVNENGTIENKVDDTVVEGSKRNDKTSAAGKSDLPDYHLYVNKGTNTVTVYKINEKGEEKPVKVMLCSVGRAGHDTPEGSFKTYEYYDWRLMVDNTYGRYAVRFNGSIMFHSVPYISMKKDTLEWEEFNKLGSRASLGCVRLCVADAKWIYSNCKRGTKVEVYTDYKDPGPLGKPKGIKIDSKSKYRDWDPTDLTKENPLLKTIE